MTRGAIEIHNLTMGFGRGTDTVVALSEISLRVKSGEFLCVLGPSGCGKSTLIGAIAGFQPGIDGHLHVDGRPVLGPGPDRGVVFQQPMLFPWMSVSDNVSFGLKMGGMSARNRRLAAEAILEEVGLTEVAKRYPAQLSGGMQQRVGLARVLVNKPCVMLMDEPFCSLDAQTRIAMQELLLQIWKEHKITVIFVTHDIDEAIYLGDRIAVLTRRPGRIKIVVDNPLPRPRTVELLLSLDFMRLKQLCMQQLREETGPVPPAATSAQTGTEAYVTSFPAVEKDTTEPASA